MSNSLLDAVNYVLLYVNLDYKVTLHMDTYFQRMNDVPGAQCPGIWTPEEIISSGRKPPEISE